MSRIKSGRLMAGALFALVGLSACATPTLYQPSVPGSAAAGGFSERRIEGNRFRVTFSGNGLTSRETVESYLLYRAAELTVAQNYDWFAMAARATDRQASTSRRGDLAYDSWHGSSFAHFAPTWHYYGGGHGWNRWDPHMGSPFFASRMDLRTIQKFEASAEIVMGRGAKPVDDPSAFDARAVVANLGPGIQRPSTR